MEEEKKISISYNFVGFEPTLVGQAKEVLQVTLPKAQPNFCQKVFF